MNINSDPQALGLFYLREKEVLLFSLITRSNRLSRCMICSKNNLKLAKP